MCKYTPVFKVTAVYYRIFKRFDALRAENTKAGPSSSFPCPSIPLLPW